MNIAPEETITHVQITAPAHIHCGLLSVGTQLPVNFGGCGLMVDSPRIQVEVSRSEGDDEFTAPTQSIERIRQIVERTRLALAAQAGAEMELPVRIVVGEMPAAHCGFGSGTQLALAIGVGVQTLLTDLQLSPSEWALALGRGQRSAIGTYGFFHGGFLIDRGLDQASPTSPLGLRIEFPAWPIAIIEFPELQGRHGIEELKAFDRIVSTPPNARRIMESLLNDEIVPSLYQKDYSRFTNSIFEFGCRSGDYYREFQKGTFHSSPVEKFVGHIRDSGWSGVLQSSWGPTLAVVLKDADDWESFLHSLGSLEGIETRVHLTHANNVGCQIETQRFSAP